MLISVRQITSPSLPWTHLGNDGMAKYAPPAYSREEINRAGRRLTGDLSVSLDVDTAIAMIHSWRLGHNQPLNGMYMTLKTRAAKVSPAAVVAQRLKRLQSIGAKLARGEVEKLTQIQDTGGCRVVFPELADVGELVSVCMNDSKTFKYQHRKDYVTDPKPAGYRSHHLIYRYVSDISAYNGLKIELQVRTRLQHSWATAVETVSTFTKLPLKSGGLGVDTPWGRFFALASSAFAAWEESPPVPNTPTNAAELLAELGSLAEQLNVVFSLNAWRTALRELSSKKSIPTDTKAFLLVLDVETNTIRWVPFKKQDLAKAEEMRLEVEKTSGKDVVVVYVDSISNLRKAYPNYFADTRQFIKAIEELIGRRVPAVS